MVQGLSPDITVPLSINYTPVNTTLYYSLSLTNAPAPLPLREILTLITGHPEDSETPSSPRQ